MAQRARSLRLINIIKTKSFFFSSAQPLVSEILRNRAKKNVCGPSYFKLVRAPARSTFVGDHSRANVCTQSDHIIKSLRRHDQRKKKEKLMCVCVCVVFVDRTHGTRRRAATTTTATPQAVFLPFSLFVEE